MATKYRKGEKCTWIVVQDNGREVLIDYKWDKPDQSPEAVYIPRVGVFVKGHDIHETRFFLPVRSISGIRAQLAMGSDGQPVEGAKPDELMKWIEGQLLTTAQKYAKRDVKLGEEVEDGND